MHFFTELHRLNPLIDGLSDNPSESNLLGDRGRWLQIRERFGVKELGQAMEKHDLTVGYKIGEVW